MPGFVIIKEIINDYTVCASKFIGQFLSTSGSLNQFFHPPCIKLVLQSF